MAFQFTPQLKNIKWYKNVNDYFNTEKCQKMSLK